MYGNWLLDYFILKYPIVGFSLIIYLAGYDPVTPSPIKNELCEFSNNQKSKCAKFHSFTNLTFAYAFKSLPNSSAIPPLVYGKTLHTG